MKQNSSLLCGLLYTALLLLCTNQALAQANAKPPTQLTYQGFLTDANGVPFGNTTPVNKTIIFRIYDALTGGSLKWSSQQVITVDKGYFSALLGEGSPVGAEPFSADLSGVFAGSTASDRYLELNADGTTIAPRLRFLAAPYALLSKSATELLDPVTGANSLSIASGNLEVGGSLKVGSVTASGSISATANVTAGGNITASGNLSGNSVNGFGTVPLGGIIMWSGSLDQLPAGWALCDGSTKNSRVTPDLRGRFIVGAGSNAAGGLTSRSVGATGGNEQSTLTVAQLPSHTHRVTGTTSTAGGHTHTVSKAPLDDRNFTDSNNNQTLGVVGDATSTVVQRTMNTGSAGDHTHTFDVTSASTGSNEAFSNMPPFYALAFIMRVQ
jgi:microcystin-dependent protein